MCAIVTARAFLKLLKTKYKLNEQWSDQKTKCALEEEPDEEEKEEAEEVEEEQDEKEEE